MSTRNPHEDDQPDAMDQGVHIAVNEAWGFILCECGKALRIEEWEMHCESEGE